MVRLHRLQCHQVSSRLAWGVECLGSLQRRATLLNHRTLCYLTLELVTLTLESEGTSLVAALPRLPIS